MPEPVVFTNLWPLRERRTWRTRLHRWAWAVVIGAVSTAVGAAIVLGVLLWP